MPNICNDFSQMMSEAEAHKSDSALAFGSQTVTTLRII